MMIIMQLLFNEVKPPTFNDDPNVVLFDKVVDTFHDDIKETVFLNEKPTNL